MGLLVRLLLLLHPVVPIPRGVWLGCGDVELLAVPKCQPGLPLRVAQRGSIRLQKLHQRIAAAQLGIALRDRRHRRGLGHRPGHVAHQVDHAITAFDVAIEHLQGFIAGDDEVLLHLHLHIRAGEQVAQALPIAQELS